jgi:type I restriction enzyme M protein
LSIELACNDRIELLKDTLFMAKKNANGTEEPLEKQLWKTADKLRKNIDAAEYKHVVLGLIFLKYISDAFEELYAKLKAEESQGADPEDKDEYKAENVFFVPPQARWNLLVSSAKQPTIGITIDAAMDAIEAENPSLKGVLPKVYALGELIDLIGNIALGDAKAISADVLGHVFEYFLGEFALAEGKKGGQFYTPRSVVELLVEMLEPYQGRVFDPCCGSGGMFVQSEKFITEHQGRVNDISIYGQESNQTTWRLCKMNLAIRGIDSSQVKWNNEGSFLNDAHKDLKADYIIANPPFNVSDWGGELLRKDGRWQYGVPPLGNANYAWIQHFLYHLAPNGQAGFVLAKGSLTSKTSGEGDIRKALIENNLIDCIVNLPAKLFLNTQIPASLWFMRRNRPSVVEVLETTDGRTFEAAVPEAPEGTATRDRSNEILFIDARNLGHLINRRTKELSNEDIQKIANTYRKWKMASSGGVFGGFENLSFGGFENLNHRNATVPTVPEALEGTIYQDIPGFCASIPISKVAELDYVLTPGRYVGLPDEEDDFNFNKRFTALKAELEEQLKEEARLNQLIAENLNKIKIIE